MQDVQKDGGCQEDTTAISLGYHRGVEAQHEAGAGNGSRPGQRSLAPLHIVDERGRVRLAGP
jgi:hypothetical protein